MKISKKSLGNTKAGHSSASWFIMSLVFSMLFSISWLFISYEKETAPYIISSVGVFLWFIVIVFSLVGVFIAMKEYVEDRMNKRMQKKPNIIKEYVKARYNKYCPTIEWVSKEQFNATNNDTQES